MKTLLERVEGLDVTIRDLQKIASRMNSGQFIPAWREINRLIANFQKDRSDLIREHSKQTEEAAQTQEELVPQVTQERTNEE